MEEPFADESMVPTFYVCEMARRYVTVALSGDGGDELFAGYDRYAKHIVRRPFPRWAANGYRKWLYPVLPSVFPGRRYAYNSSLDDCERYLDSMSGLCGWDRDRDLFSPDFLRRGKDGSLVRSEFRRIYDSAPAPDVVGRMQYLDTLTYLHADVLAKVDRMSMANSLEVRCPLLDHVVVEAAAKLPSGWKLHGQEGKYILKKLAERVGVPRSVLYRKKQGFAMPLVKWFRRELKDELINLLLDSRTLQRGYFNERGVRTLLNEHFTGRRDRSLEVWTLLVFELWHRNFLERLTSLRPEPAVAGAIRSLNV
jgi:asparagine synthase (glutamine-hydrolysing)